MTRFTPKLGQDPAYMKDTDPRSEPIPFVLTPFERDEAKVFALQAEMRRRKQNAEDDARAAAKALEDFTPRHPTSTTSAPATPSAKP